MILVCSYQGEGSVWIFSQTMIYLPIKISTAYSEFSLMKHSHELFRSHPQAMKIRLGEFLGVFHVWALTIKLLKYSQWQSMENHCYGGGAVNPKPIPHPQMDMLSGRRRIDFWFMYKVTILHDFQGAPLTPIANNFQSLDISFCTSKYYFCWKTRCRNTIFCCPIWFFWKLMQVQISHNHLYV